MDFSVFTEMSSQGPEKINKDKGINFGSYFYVSELKYSSGGYISLYICQSIECTAPRVDPKVNHGLHLGANDVPV